MVIATGLLLLFATQADGWPQTRAEATEYRETSHYADVVAFLDGLQRKGAPFVVREIGKSPSGKGIPLVVASNPPVTGPEQARRLGKPVVYVQANIHAGEVEGKEALLMLLRDLAKRPKGSVLDKIVLVATPIYNIDGNDAFGPQSRNRGAQDGPEMVGQRANGQGFDLNRDCMKAESNEMRAVLDQVYRGWDPDVIMDLHTTDGTRHGYPLTYSPPLTPDTEAGVLAYARDELVTSVRNELRAKHGLETFDYGNLVRANEGPRWEVFGAEGRYVTNYAGLRNRIGILSEALSYCSFQERVEVTRRFVDAILAKVAKDAPRIVRLTRTADDRAIAWGNDPASAPKMGVRFAMASRGFEDVLVEKSDPQGSPRTVKKPINLEKVRSEVLDRFRATESERFPAGYLIPADCAAALDLLRRHGILLERLEESWTGPCQTFEVSGIEEARAAFQGHKLKTLEGAYLDETRAVPAGTILARTAQPLGILLFHLAEPRSLDGLAAWDFLEGKLEAGKPYPILKAMVPLRVATRAF
ncbi:MAG: M14 family metallopeptidase [Fimbriimonadaceae bacterium]|nr:M14 family metallopeptidase [Fimbriimonadaceae bacterium]